MIIASNPASHSERTLVTCWHLFLVENYRILSQPAEQMSGFSLRCSDLVKACRTELTIHLRKC
jgi:hypothetical protein